MKNTFGNNLTVTLFGESHGPAIGAVVDGLTPGLNVEKGEIEAFLALRRPNSPLDTKRREKDEFEILSGVFDGKTTGTPLCIVIPNKDVKSGDYYPGLNRPSHGDFTGHVKYDGFEDYRGGGHFSGRITAALTAVGGILLPALKNLGISVETRVIGVGTATGDRAAMDEEIARVQAEKDSVGGKTETIVTGLPIGLGEPWFDSVEGLLSHGLFSIGGVKAVEFGDGFRLSEMQGSAANDAFTLKDGKIVTKTNHNGGICGGITNGMPVVFRCAVKPTPSIGKAQETVNFINGEESTLTLTGRHDPAIVRRVAPVIDSITAMVISDLLIGRFEQNVLREGFTK